MPRIISATPTMAVATIGMYLILFSKLCVFDISVSFFLVQKYTYYFARASAQTNH